MRRPRAPGRPSRWAVLLVLAVVTSGCGAAAGQDPAPPSSATPSAASPSAAVPVPADGLPLRAFGYSFGPLDAFSLPRGTMLVTSVDQADNVTAVLAAPSPLEVAGYLRRALPAAGFTVTADDGVATLTFAGQGWTGRLTGGDATSAVLLRPA